MKFAMILAIGQIAYWTAIGMGASAWHACGLSLVLSLSLLIVAND